MLTRERRLAILHGLSFTSCEGCGGEKKERMSHCRRCYFALPQAMRRALYRSFGDGYEEAFEESLAYLRAEKERSLR